MARRRRGGLIDTGVGTDTPFDPGAPDSIEILDLDTSTLLAEPGLSEPDHEPAGRGRSSLASIVVVGVVGGLAALGVVTTGNTPAPEPPAPSVTAPPDPAALAQAERAAEIFELEATYGVQIGDGPDLDWRFVPVGPTSANSVGQTPTYVWIDDSFVTDDGALERTIRPADGRLEITERPSLTLDFPDYELRLLDGARLLFPLVGASDHVIVVVADGTPVRIELPPAGLDATSELNATRRHVNDGGLIGDRLIITASLLHSSEDEDGQGSTRPGETTEEAWSLDVSRAVAEPLPLDFDATFGAISRTTNGIAMPWIDDTGQAWLSTTSDGAVWSTIPADDELALSYDGSTLVAVDLDSPDIRRSPDAGRTWQRTRKPFPSSNRHVALNDVHVMVQDNVGALGDDDAAADVLLDTDRYTVTITGGGRTFEVVDRESGEVVLDAAITDSASGVAFDPFGSGLAITDPTSGIELLSISQGQLLRAFIEANGSQSGEIAITRWDPAQADPEWRIEPIDDVFADALRVELVPGGDVLLAVVTTPTGTDLYLGSTLT